MAGKRIIVFAAFALAALALALSARGGAEAQTYRPFNSYSLTNTAPDANSNSAIGFSIAAPDYNYEDASMTILQPVDSVTATGLEAPIGAYVGTLNASVAVGLLGGPCNQALTPNFNLKNASVDVGVQDNNTSWILKPTSTTIPDEDGDFLYDYEEKYPWFLNQMLDPDGTGPLLPIQPRARFAAHTSVASNWVLVQFLVFNPGQMTALGGIYTQMTAEKGAPNYIVLDNPIGEGEATPGAIADFCTPLSTVTTLYSVTANNPATAANEYGFIRQTNPAANTGVLLKGTHMAWNYSQSERDIDGDNFENDLDGCRYRPDIPGWNPRTSACVPGSNPGDQDCDMLPSSCDSNDVAPGGTDTDEDNDGYDNAQDNCPLVANGCKDALCGSPFNALWDNQDDRDAGLANADVGPRSDAIGDSCDDSDDDGDEDGAGGLAAPGSCNDGLDNDGDTLRDDLDPQCVPSLDKADWPPVPATQPQQGAYYHGYPWAAACVINGAENPACVNDIDDDANDDPNDRVNDGCPAKDAPENPSTQCADAVDDDGDTRINDGCPINGLLPENPACVNDVDDDGDTTVNDGCPAKDSPETLCGNAIDDDGDTRVNDGCAILALGDTDGDGYCDVLEGVLGSPMYSGAETGTECTNAADDDGDGFYNDGCPFVGKYGETGAQCLNATDDDALEAPADGRVNDGCPVIGTPESLIIDATMNATGGLPTAIAAQSCSDGIDNDNDGYVDAADVGCQPAAVSGDADHDGWADNKDIGFDANMTANHVGVETYTGDTGMPAFNWTYDPDTGEIVIGLGADQQCWIIGPGDEDPAANAEDAECVNSQDDDPADDPDHRVNDGCPAKDAAENPATECANSIDDDGDTRVNDGCPVNGALPENPACVNNIDDDGDTNINDGCPRKGPAESSECVNAIDDDPTNDAPGSWVNDGCPAKGTREAQATQCANNTDDDGDTRVNDGCDVQGTPPVAENASCANDIDDDGDTTVNDGCLVKAGADGEMEAQVECKGQPLGLWQSVDLDADTDPDIMWWKDFVDPRDPTGQDNCPTVWNPAQTDTDGGVGDGESGAQCNLAVDDDGDSIVNDGCPAVNLPETGAQCADAVDANEDGAPDKVNDGCPIFVNGDACDADDDADGTTDTIENYLPTDPLDDCRNGAGATRSDAWPLDQNLDGVVTVPGDVLKYSGKINAQVSASPPTSWTLSRLDLNGDRVITVPGDVLKYSGKINAVCN